MASSSHDHQYPDKLVASADEQGANRRVDRAHRIRGDQDENEAVTVDRASGDAAASDAAPSDDPVVALLGEGPHVHLQAEQLARLLADRLAEIDRREAQLHVLSADLDNQQRTARLTLVEREQQLDHREAFLTRLETSAGHGDRPHAHDHDRLDRFLRADSTRDAEPDDAAGEDDEQVSASTDAADNLDAALAARQQRLDAIRITLVEEHRRLVDSRRTLEDWARRQRDEIERQSAELTLRRQAVERQEANNQRWNAERAACYEELQRLRRGLRRSAKSA